MVAGGAPRRRQFRLLSLSPGVVVSATGVEYPACRFHARLPNGLRGSWNPKLIFGCQEWASCSMFPLFYFCVSELTLYTVLSLIVWAMRTANVDRYVGVIIW